MTTELVVDLRSMCECSGLSNPAGICYTCRAADEIERLREGLRLIATDEHRLMGVTARQTAESILSGKCAS